MSYSQQLECIKVIPTPVGDVKIVKEEDRKKLNPTQEDATFQDAGDAVSGRPRQTVNVLGASIGTFVIGRKYDFAVTEAAESQAEPPPPPPGPSEVAAGPGPDEPAAKTEAPADQPPAAAPATE